MRGKVGPRSHKLAHLGGGSNHLGSEHTLVAASASSAENPILLRYKEYTLNHNINAPIISWYIPSLKCIGLSVSGNRETPLTTRAQGIACLQLSEAANKL